MNLSSDPMNNGYTNIILSYSCLQLELIPSNKNDII